MPERSIVELTVAAEAAELAADALWQHHPSAVGEATLPDGRVRLTADVVDPAPLIAGWGATVLELDSDAYLDAWRAWARPVRAGRRIVLHPAWLPRDPDGEDLVIVLDPGRSFGSGSHPSTRMALAALEELVVGGESVLDVGCGSGVLAIGAVLLGAARAVGIDLDPAALPATRSNAEANGVSDRVAVSDTSLRELDTRFDLVVANIGARVLRELAADLEPRVRPGGHLVLAGLLDEQADEVVAAYPDCDEVRRSAEAGWVTLVLRRRTLGGEGD